MNWLKKIRLFTVLFLTCGILLSASVTSCKKAQSENDDATEQAADSTEHPEGEHPEGEHPESDSTDAE